MKEITLFENVDMSKSMEEQGINNTLYWAYQAAKESGNNNIDFNEVIWDYDIEAIVKNLRDAGITEFTISSTFSSLIETLAAFAAQGVTMNGLTQVYARYTDWNTGEPAIIPAIKMSI